MAMNSQSDDLLPRLLVIDDEPSICFAVSLLLQDIFLVDTANSPAEGLSLLAEPYAMILLDLRMPGVTEYEMIEKVRAKTGITPIIILTAMVDDRTSEEVLQHGATSLIAKPFSRQELVMGIQKVLTPQT